MKEKQKRGAKLPGRLRIVQSRGRGGGYWITLPKELCEDLGWGQGSILEFVRKKAHVELHRREVHGDS